MAPSEGFDDGRAFIGDNRSDSSGCPREASVSEEVADSACAGHNGEWGNNERERRLVQ